MSPLIHNQTQLPLEAGKTLFDYADDLAVRVPTSCNRNGECHECIVEVRRGMDALEPLNDTEDFLRDNYRLACQARVVDIEADIEFNVLRRQPRILTESIDPQDINKENIELDPLTTREGNNIIFKGDLPPFAKRKGARASEAMRAGDARGGVGDAHA
ncbi:MAG: 2Fe-2S iron-sulfur cluster binding domain-containing protein, partial [Chloroflexi bacterium]|nr:2Fe-2S iron-sulfur cluster binding domain-containing protein [Chloroflexota bacterium]